MLFASEVFIPQRKVLKRAEINSLYSIHNNLFGYWYVAGIVLGFENIKMNKTKS